MRAAVIAMGVWSMTIAFAQDAAPIDAGETIIAMPNANAPFRPISLRIPDGWTQAKTLAGSHALVFTQFFQYGRSFVSVDVGKSEPRIIARWNDVPGTAPFASTFPGVAWEPDGSACYSWLHDDVQLCRVDTPTGAMKSITEFPTFMPRLISEHTLRPMPIVRPGGVVPYKGRLLCVVHDTAGATSKTANGARDPGQARLVAIDPTDATIVDLSESPWPSALHAEWDIAHERGVLYATTLTNDHIAATTFTGAPLWDLTIDAQITALRLSPDEQFLLVERKGELRAGGGFILVNADDHSVREGPARGRDFAWSPDSKRVAFLDSGTAQIHDVESATNETIGTLDRPMDDDAADAPVWSPDGRMLVANLGSWRGHVVFDLEQHTVLTLEDSLITTGNLGFAPVAKPFPNASH